MAIIYTIPKSLIAEWDQAKKRISKIGSTAAPDLVAADQKKLHEQASILIGRFDQGLKAKMKVAAGAKSEADARKAAGEVARVAADYKKELDIAVRNWAQMGVVGDRIVVNALGPVLEKISLHALASTKARAPIVFTKDLQVIQDSFQKGVTAALKRIPTLPLKTDEKKILTTKLTTMTGHLQVGLKPAFNKAKQAASEDGLRESMEDLRRSLDISRRKVYDDTGKLIKPVGAAVAMQTEFEDVFIETRNRIGELIVKLDKASR